MPADPASHSLSITDPNGLDEPHIQRQEAGTDTPAHCREEEESNRDWALGGSENHSWKSQPSLLGCSHLSLSDLGLVLVTALSMTARARMH